MKYTVVLKDDDNIKDSIHQQTSGEPPDCHNHLLTQMVPDTIPVRLVHKKSKYYKKCLNDSYNSFRIKDC